MEPVETKATYNDSKAPWTDRHEMCAFLFRKGTKPTEAEMQPDMDLVYEMRDRRVRVQDLLDYLLPMAGTNSEAVDNLLEYWRLRKDSPTCK